MQQKQEEKIVLKELTTAIFTFAFLKFPFLQTGAAIFKPYIKSNHLYVTE
jgi:hypothetical protein